MSKSTKQFIHLSEAWYGEAVLPQCKYTDEVMFGYPDAECSMRWYDLADGKFPAPKLEVFNDSFLIFQEADLFTELKLKQGKWFSPEDFCELLERHGFKNKTPYKRT